MTPALAGWIVCGVFCAGALFVMLLGVFHLSRAQREVKRQLARLEETQRRIFQPERIEAALGRISRDAQSANEPMQRARLALSTIAVAARYCAIAVRLVKMLA